MTPSVRCPECGELLYRIDHSYWLGELYVEDIDPTWRHTKTGTLACAEPELEDDDA
jgi:hypothetical protein